MDDWETQVFAARVLALVEREAMARALACPDPLHRAEALFYLALLGWTEDAFLEEAFNYDFEDDCDG
jgi:hypothetical protein